MVSFDLISFNYFIFFIRNLCFLLLVFVAENATYAAIAESTLEVVLAVPIHWSPQSRKQYCKAVRDGGFEVLQVISEPSAALLAYNIGVDANESSNVLVVRLGGLSSEITIMSVENGLYTVVDTLHLAHLGGNVLTKVLSEYLATEFFNKYKLDPRESKRAMVKMDQTAENVKHILSKMPSAHVFVESLIDGIDWSQNISRARFENVIGPKLSLFSKPIDEFIKKHNVEIDKVSERISIHNLKPIFLNNLIFFSRLFMLVVQ